MKTLLIMRHAKSSWADAGVRDHDRPLNARGKRAAPRMGQLLCDEQLLPEVLLSSTAKRARKTAEKVAAQCGSPEIQLCSEFYLASPATYVETLQQQPDNYERILIVGHNPGLEQLLTKLTGAQEALPTAALAHVELELTSWSGLSQNSHGRLVALWLPRELDG